MKIVCDFCSKHDVHWRYPCEDFEMPTVLNIRQMSIGDWAACDLCHELIETGNYGALALRSWATTPNRPVVPVKMIKKLFILFARNRTANPIEMRRRGTA